MGMPSNSVVGRGCAIDLTYIIMECKRDRTGLPHVVAIYIYPLLTNAPLLQPSSSFVYV